MILAQNEADPNFSRSPPASRQASLLRLSSTLRSEGCSCDLQRYLRTLVTRMAPKAMTETTTRMTSAMMVDGVKTVSAGVALKAVYVGASGDMTCDA